MIEIHNNIFVGNEQDYYSIQRDSGWGILHCCKSPFHQAMVGYSGNLQSTHPNYAYIIQGNQMALNLVDMDIFNAISVNYVEFNRNMFEQAFVFLDKQVAIGNKVLIHCNQGESRAPSLGMLYVARLGKWNWADFETTMKEFVSIFPRYSPKKNILMNIKLSWNYFIKNQNSN